MELDHVTFVGPPIDDHEILAKIPANLAGLLQQLNGFIQFHGGLHVRGACRQPSWHSLRDAWVGVHAFHSLYPTVHPEDVPFTEDCLGDQFLLRDERVHRLAAETGELQALNLSLAGSSTRFRPIRSNSCPRATPAVPARRRQTGTGAVASRLPTLLHRASGGRRSPGGHLRGRASAVPGGLRFTDPRCAGRWEDRVQARPVSEPRLGASHRRSRRATPVQYLQFESWRPGINR